MYLLNITILYNTISIHFRTLYTSYYYTCKKYQDAHKYKCQDKKGTNEIIFIVVADCIISPDKAEYKSNRVILDQNSFEHDLKDFYFIFIELLKFTKTKEDQLKNIVEKWCYFFWYEAKTREEDLDKIVGSDVIIKCLFDVLTFLSFSLAFQPRGWGEQPFLRQGRVSWPAWEFLPSSPSTLHPSPLPSLNLLTHSHTHWPYNLFSRNW